MDNMLFGLLLLAFLAVQAEASKVSCGGHKADDCKACPMGHGAKWCNGDCKWCDKGGCQSKAKACKGEVSCGGHKAADCKACPNGHGASWCNGDCKWCGQGGCQLKSETCKVAARWSPWSSYTPCTRTCGSGTMLRMRICSIKGKCQGSSQETAQCNAKACVVNGHWGPWSPYSTCSKTCGRVEAKRTRLCNSPPPSNGGKQCPGQSTETKVLNLVKCTVDGGWGSWAAYSACSKTCGAGEIKRTRVCNNPSPGNGGKQCAGQSSETKVCNIKECQAGTQNNPGTSCNTLKAKYGSKKSGMYWIKLDKPTQVYCDMETAGGGWTMVGQAVANKESDSVNIDYKKIQSSDISRLGDVKTNRFLLDPAGLNKLQKYISFTQIRFFCTKPWHGRTIDLTTRRNSIGKQVVDLLLRKSNSRPSACGSFDRLPRDNSMIGRGCNRWNGHRWNDNIFVFPMYIYGHAHISLLPSRIECDDDRHVDRSAGRRFSSVGRWAFYVR